MLWLCIRNCKWNLKIIKEKADACNSGLPPRIAAEVGLVREKADKIPIDKITFDLDGMKASVLLVTKPSKRATVNLGSVGDCGKEACSLSCSVLTGNPCPHMIAAADAKGEDLSVFMHRFGAAIGYKEQYEKPAFEAPTDDEYDAHMNLRDESLALYPRIKRNRGRPVKMRKRGSVERSQSNVTCRCCFRKGHTKRSKKCGGAE